MIFFFPFVILFEMKNYVCFPTQFNSHTIPDKMVDLHNNFSQLNQLHNDCFVLKKKKKLEKFIIEFVAKTQRKRKHNTSSLINVVLLEY